MSVNRKIDFFANPYSPHVFQWLELTEMVEGFDFGMLHVRHSSKPCRIPAGVCEVKSPLWSIFVCFPSFLQYFFLGIYYRFFVKEKASFVHAHNTSGYGLAALLSGAPYGVTTYGSEIFGAGSKSFFYRKMISAVLRKSLFVTSTSRAMTQVLVSDFNVDAKKIFEFSLGVSKNIKFSLLERGLCREKKGVSLDSKLFFVNRRAAPLYQVAEVIKCFSEVFDNDSSYHLFVLSGDCDVEYLKTLKSIAEKLNSNISFIDNFLPQEELSKILSASDFIISTPKTDQLSSSILEGIACRSVPILSNLESYSPLKEAVMLVDNVNFEKNLIQVYEKIKVMSTAEYDAYVVRGELLLSELSIQSASAVYESVLNEFFHVP